MYTAYYNAVQVGYLSICDQYLWVKTIIKHVQFIKTMFIVCLFSLSVILGLSLSSTPACSNVLTKSNNCWQWQLNISI